MDNKVKKTDIVGSIKLESVYVGDAGNTSDTIIMLTDGTTGYGAVPYNYQIGVSPVSCGQYVQFLNAVASKDPYGLYNPNMASNIYGGTIIRNGEDGSYSYSTQTPNRPVVYIGFWDAARFANWLTSSDTEKGVYNLNGQLNPDNSSVSRDVDAWRAGGWAIANEDEWYKAAYYDPKKGGYNLYPTSSNEVSPKEANYYESAINTVVDSGSYPDSPSPYGTLDQGGNIWEWIDAVAGSEYRILRGGAFRNNVKALESSHRLITVPFSESYFLGFRLSKLA